MPRQIDNLCLRVACYKENGRVQNFSLAANKVSTTEDHIHNDTLICADFFGPACGGSVIPAPPSSPTLAFPKAHPLPPGSYLINIHYKFSERYNNAFGMAPSNFFVPGETLVFAQNFLDVIKRV